MQTIKTIIIKLLAAFYLLVISVFIIACGQNSNESSKTTTYNKDKQKPFFSIIIYPDSHIVQENSYVFKTQNQWVVNNIGTQNILAVLGVGDIVDEISDSSFLSATISGYDLLDKTRLPYLPLMGNHDWNDIDKRDSSKYDQYFGPFRFTGKSWYLGGYPANSNANMAIIFSFGDISYLVIGLEFFPRPAAVLWAQSLIDANPKSKVIIVTHAFLTRWGLRYQDNDLYGPVNSGLDPNYNYSGQKLWDNFIKINKHIFLVISGHDICNPYSAHLVTSGINGNNVLQIFNNFQCEPGNKNTISILKFWPSESVVEVNYFSTIFQENDSNSPSYFLNYSSPI